MQHESDALDELSASLRGRFGGRLTGLALFGSRARGDGNEDSDLDVLITINGMTTADGRVIDEITGDLLTKYDVLIGAFALSTERFAHLRARERRIVAEIDRDGVPL